MSKHNLLTFLKAIAQDAGQLARFEANPHDFMRDSGLTATQQELILNHDIAGLKNEFGSGNWTPILEIVTFKC